MYCILPQNKINNQEGGVLDIQYPVFTTFIIDHFLTTSENKTLKNIFFLTIESCSSTNIIVGH